MTERITIDTPIRFHDPLPEAVDVAIVGGGVIGVFAALYLARAGRSVLLCEKGRIAGEQSSRNWGWIRQQGRDQAELPIVSRALELWKEVDAETGGACGLRVGGTLYLSDNPDGAPSYHDWIALAGEHGLDSTLLSQREIADLFDGSPREMWRSGLYTPSDARAEPWRAVPAVAKLAQEEGVAIRENCAVRTLDLSAGHVQGIVTEDGPVRAEQVILAAGAWSSLFARRHGIDIPQLSLRATVAQTAPLPQVYHGNACDNELAVRRREDGGYSLALTDEHAFYIGPDALRRLRRYLPVLKTAWHDLGIRLTAPVGYPDGWRTARRWDADEETPFERQRVLEPAADPKLVARMAERFAKRFPALGVPQINQAWAGMIDTMPDVVPVVDRVPSCEGLIVATGMSGHGFGIGPGFGEALMQIAMHQTPAHDMTRFRFGRFTDGSPIDVGPGL